MKKYKSIILENGNKKEKIPLYNPCYTISYLELKTPKKIKFSNIIILSCRYLGNYFNIQNTDNNINIFCEDFVTCIKANTKDSNNIFYTGLFNGKLITNIKRTTRNKCSIRSTRTIIKRTTRIKCSI